MEHLLQSNSWLYHIWLGESLQAFFWNVFGIPLTITVFQNTFKYTYYIVQQLLCMHAVSID